MATQPIPEARSLASWGDAFQYPLPVVRKLEQQLRKNIEDNRGKLRSLVGTSYRDLLGTAERIIEMDEQIQHVEEHMRAIGRKCNARSMERVAENHGHMTRLKGSTDEAKLRRISQARILQNAIAQTGRLIESGGDDFVAAKLLILARVLHKSLSEGPDPPTILEDLRKRLSRARKRLSSYISRSLLRPGTDKPFTINSLCAYSLVSTASPKDVLRYFLQVRFEQLEAKAETTSEDHLMEMLDLYSQTLLDTRELFPKRYSNSLSQLSKGTLVRDEDIRTLSTLSLDVYEQWISDDVRHFHPWIRHDELLPLDVNNAIASWMKQAQSCLLQAVVNRLGEYSDVHGVLRLRYKVLSKYLSLSATIRGNGYIEAIHRLRNVFLDRLEQLADQEATLSNLKPSTPKDFVPESKNTWSLASDNMDLKGGAVQFRKTVLAQHYGRSPSIARALSALDEWHVRIHTFTEAVVTMRSTRWEEDLDLDLDDLTDEEPLQVVLNKQDSHQVEQRLHQAATSTLHTAYRDVEQYAEPDANAAMILRTLREIDQRRRSLSEEIEGIDSIRPNEDFIAALHTKVSMQVAGDLIAQYASSLSVRADGPTSLTLWDGSPPLPVQPTPGAFRFVKSLHGQMSDAGNDLWSPNAVEKLKVHVCESLEAQIDTEGIRKSTKLPLTNGHADGQNKGVDLEENRKESPNGEHLPAADASQPRHIQHLFDVLYLELVLTTNKGANGLDGVTGKLRSMLDLDDVANERLRKAAHEYWKRTYLLFGLLAVGQVRQAQ